MTSVGKVIIKKYVSNWIHEKSKRTFGFNKKIHFEIINMVEEWLNLSGPDDLLEQFLKRCFDS